MTLLRNLSRFVFSSSLKAALLDQSKTKLDDMGPHLEFIYLMQPHAMRSAVTLHSSSCWCTTCREASLLPVRSKDQVAVYEPGGHDQTNQFKQSTNDRKLVNTVNDAR